MKTKGEAINEILTELIEADALFRQFLAQADPLDQKDKKIAEAMVVRLQALQRELAVLNGGN